MQWFLLLLAAGLVAAQSAARMDQLFEEMEQPTRRGGCARRTPSPSWVRQNAENLLFLEYLQSEAAKGDLYGWKAILQSDEFQQKLDSLRSGITTLPGELDQDCGVEVDESVLIDRISSLESRFSSCGGGGFECGMACGSGCELNDQKLMVLQAELRRQRMMIQRLYSQVIILSSSGGNNCGCKTLHFFSHV